MTASELNDLMEPIWKCGVERPLYSCERPNCKRCGKRLFLLRYHPTLAIRWLWSNAEDETSCGEVDTVSAIALCEQAMRRWLNSRNLVVSTWKHAGKHAVELVGYCGHGKDGPMWQEMSELHALASTILGIVDNGTIARAALKVET